MTSPWDVEMAKVRPSGRRRLVHAVIVVAVIAVVAGVVIANVQQGQAVANRIEASGSSLIASVSFVRSNPFEGSPDEIHVALVQGTTVAQAEAFWCEIVIPAGHDPVRARVSISIVDGRPPGSKLTCPTGTPAP
jgi:hypothetical protein